ncbi:MAG: hypothetical protein NUW24_02850 [Anaerolineae bacterium]|jgi:hypothetical protein|nr:hypothetical protein [Anaerolineae bacterium]MDH7473375.1 hypothetical protein [Anaerolineae bacterium]
MSNEQDLRVLWRQVVEDYNQIRQEQEKEWASLSLEDRVWITEQLMFFLQEVERSEKRRDYAGDVSSPAEGSG